MSDKSDIQIGFNNWDLHNIDMAVPMSPSQINHKTTLIHLHHSQLDQLLFLEEDDIGFWSRTANLNRLIAKEFNFLGMSEYEGIQAVNDLISKNTIPFI